jgi:group I intron endonuclease
MDSGIYTIENLVNGKIYLGYAVGFRKRWSKHKSELNNKKHSNCHLQHAWNEYGSDQFKFEVLEEWPKEYLCTMEHYWALMLCVHNRDIGYNIKPTHPYGKVTPTAETIEKCRIASTGKKRSAEHSAKLSANKKGNKNWVGRKHKQSTLDKFKIVNSGRICTSATKLKMSISRKGKRPKCSGYNSKIVIQYNTNNEIVQEYSSIVECAKSIGRGQTIIRKSIRNKGQYVKDGNVYKIKQTENKTNKYMNKKWEYDPLNGDKAISDSDGSIVLYTEDIKPEVIAVVVEKWNAGTSVKDIQKWLYKEAEGVTLDESDYIVEQLESWIKLSGDTGTAEPAVTKAPVVGNQLPDTTEKVEDVKSETQKLMEETAKLQGVTLSRGEKAAATRKANQASKPKSATPGNKAVDAKSLVEKMKEQIALIEWIDGALPAMELPSALSKDAREVLITLQKTIETAKTVAVMTIQEL